MQMTTKALEEIRRRNAEGQNDTEIAEALGTRPQTIRYYRAGMGLPPVLRKREKRNSVTYTVRDRKTGRLLVSGTAKECALALGYANAASFRAAAPGAKKYLCSKRARRLEPWGRT